MGTSDAKNRHWKSHAWAPLREKKSHEQHMLSGTDTNIRLCPVTWTWILYISPGSKCLGFGLPTVTWRTLSYKTLISSRGCVCMLRGRLGRRPNCCWPRGTAANRRWACPSHGASCVSGSETCRSGERATWTDTSMRRINLQTWKTCGHRAWSYRDDDIIECTSAVYI
jgi:hypothetical protein